MGEENMNQSSKVTVFTVVPKFETIVLPTSGFSDHQPQRLEESRLGHVRRVLWIQGSEKCGCVRGCEGCRSCNGSVDANICLLIICEYLRCPIFCEAVILQRITAC